MIVFLVCICCYFNVVRGLHHSVDITGSNGFQLANEFQLINFTNMKSSITKKDFARTVSKNIKSSSSERSIFYEITSVYPRWIKNDGVVNVTFRSDNASNGDWIGAYSPPINASQISSTSPVKYGWCDEVSTYLADGYGYLLFNLTNLRADVAFYYFKGGLNYPILVNSSASQFNVSFRNNNEPLRPRIVATGDPDVLELLWSSATSQQPTLKWGLSPGVYSTVVAAQTSHINRSSICGAPGNSYGWRDLGLLHSARIEGMSSLPVSARIYYVFGDAADGLFSPETVFLSPPPAGSQPATRPTTLALYCDLGRGSLDMTYTWNEYGRPSINTTMALGQRVKGGQVDAVFHGGDISYATGYLAVWDFFLDQIAPIAGGALYLTTVGNHESDWPGSPSYYTGTDSGGECGVAATLLLPMPQPATTNQPWWSYEVGLFHLVGMSTEHNFTRGSPQWLWLQRDLAAVNRSRTPWVLLNGHRAMYINSDYGGSASSDIAVMDLLIQQVEPLLWRYRVNLAFYGHNHAVQRQAAVLNKTVVQASVPEVDGQGVVTHMHRDPQATVHMVVGTGGAAFTVNYVTPYPAWSEMVMYEYGYALVSSVNESYLEWSWFSSGSGALLDRMVITQSTNWSQPWVLPSEATAASSSSSSSGGGSGLDAQWVALLACGGAALAVCVGAAWLRRRRVRPSDGSGEASFATQSPLV